MVFTSFAWLYDTAERLKSQYIYYKNIAQINAADFMQIDEIDIIYIIVCNSWTTAKVCNTAERRQKPRSAVFRSRRIFYMPDHFILLYIFYTV